MANITIGGLATGLDTNSIVDQLTALEKQRDVDPLTAQQSTAQDQSSALQVFNSKVLNFLSAVDKLRDPDSVLSRTATSTNTSVLTAVGGDGALNGSTSITVTNLAKPAIASSSATKTSADAKVATGTETFEFKVGTGTAQSIAIDGTTTLQGLATSINGLGAGVSASVVNIGTTGTPDFRLRLTSNSTGSENNVTITHDGTNLGVGVKQSAEDAQMTVSGFTDPVKRASNTFDDVVPGVSISLASLGGPVTVGVSTNFSGVANKIQAVVTAFNDIVSFVDQQSDVSQDTSATDRTVSQGPLAFDGTVRSILETLHGTISNGVSGLSSQYTLLAEVGVTTNKDGTLAFDTTKLNDALTKDDRAVAALFGGSTTTAGIADKLHDYLTGITQAKGLLAVRTDSLTSQIKSLQDRIEEGQRQVDAFEENLRATFSNLEVLVSGLKSQGAFLTAALGGTS
jgi:flagellar hook-associated protein 2